MLLYPSGQAFTHHICGLLQVFGHVFNDGELSQPGMYGFDGYNCSCQVKTEDNVKDDQYYGSQIGRDQSKQIF